MTAPTSLDDAFSKESSSTDIADEVLIFIPGLGHEDISNVKTISEKVLRGFRASSSVEARYGLEQRAPERYGEGSVADVARVIRIDSAPNATVDIYDLQYGNEMLADLNALSPLSKALSFALALLNCISGVSRVFWSAALRKRKLRPQIIYGLLVYFAMWLYVISLVISAVQALSGQPAVQKAWQSLVEPIDVPVFVHPPYFVAWSAATSNFFSGFMATPVGWFSGNLSGLIWVGIVHISWIIWNGAPRLAIVLTLVGILFPGLLANISGAALDLVAMLDYFNLGERRNRVTGQLGDLIRYVSQRQDSAHKAPSIRIVTHSFGCIVLLDTLFFSDELSEDDGAFIKCSSTIGNPLAIVNVFWPGHYTGQRGARCNAPILNIYSCDDVLSSSVMEILVAPVFANLDVDDIEYSRATEKAVPTWLNILNGFMFRAHAMYWDVAGHPDASCFNSIIPRFYSGGPMLPATVRPHEAA